MQDFNDFTIIDLVHLYDLHSGQWVCHVSLSLCCEILSSIVAIHLSPSMTHLIIKQSHLAVHSVDLNEVGTITHAQAVLTLTLTLTLILTNAYGSISCDTQCIAQTNYTSAATRRFVYVALLSHGSLVTICVLIASGLQESYPTSRDSGATE